MNSTELTGRARVYARALTVISRREGLSGRGRKPEYGARYLSFGVRLRDELQIDKALRMAEALALATNTPVVIAKRQGGVILYQFQLPQGLWDSYTRADLQTDRDHIGLGLSEGRRQIDFIFSPPHALVAGTTRIAGKSKTVESILCGLFTAYRPDELTAVICDPHQDYLNFHNVSHLAVPVAHETQSITQAIAYTHAELIRRKNHNARQANPFVMVLDEAETELKDPKRRLAVENLGKEAAKFQMFLIIATQKPKASNLGDLFTNLGNRFIGKVPDSQTSYFLSGVPGLGCQDLTGKGDFMHVGLTVERLQVALATQADFDRLPRGNNGDPPEFEDVAPLDVDQLPEPEPEPRGPGRPETPIDPWMIGFYDAMGPGNVSRNKAREVLGLGYDLHKRHREFAKIVAIARKAVQEQWMNER